jgi:hypothetical protein
MPALPTHLTLIVELALIVLLSVTLGYCVLLERRLAAMRKGQDALKSTIGQLNHAIASAGNSLGQLRATAHDASSSLDERLGLARKLIDELSVLTTSGERIAERFDRGFDRASEQRPRIVRSAPVHPGGGIMSRLDAVKVAR